MSRLLRMREHGTGRLSISALICSIAGVVMLGGCPVPQQPTAPAPDDERTGNAPNVVPSNRNIGGRPIPPLPVDDGSQQDEFGGVAQPGTPTVPDVPDEPDEPQAPALRVTVLGPNTNLEILRDEPVEIDYRVDGDAQNIELIYDLEGGETAVVAQSGLNVEGKVVFSTDVAGLYAFSIRASSSDDEVVQPVPGSVTVVGDMAINFSKPTRNLIVRPNVPVEVAYTVATLASSINAEVFVDPDPAVEGDETRMFSSILKSVSETFNTQTLELGIDYSIYVEVTDSVGQTSGRITAPNTFRIMPVPTIAVTAPSSASTIDPGDPVRVEFVGNDIENIATITVFVDTDTDFNNGIDILAADLPISETTFVVDTSSFVAGTYFFGAWVADADTGDIYRWDYAPGLRSIAGITITAPSGDTTVRTPNTVELRWRSIYTASEFTAHQVVVAPDADNDGEPDGPLQVVADGFDPVPASNSFPISTVGLKGRYLAGVRLIDNNGREIVKFAAGDLIVLNDAPNVQINQPSDLVAVRPGTPQSQIRMNFFVADAEGQNELVDITVVVARDDDVNGVPDGAPVLSLSDPSFRLGTNGSYIFDADQLQPLINDGEHDGYGWFLLGVRVVDDAGQEALAWTPGLYVDDVEPAVALNDPSAQLTIKDRIGTLNVEVAVSDSSPTAARVMLDLNLNPNGQDQELVPWTFFGPNETKQFEIDLTTLESGYYLLYLQVADPVEVIAHYLPEGVIDPSLARALWIRDRRIGVIEVGSLGNSDDGAILQGFNFNDLGGSSMERVADVDNDGDDEFIIVSRYGKPFLLGNTTGVGFGEAFLIYGNDGNNNINDPIRLRGTQTLNAVGGGSIKGLTFPGIRIPLNATAETTGMTEGISDVTVVEDMDGDELPEIVFSFPRVESINLGEGDTRFQHPELLPDIPGMGSLEYNALYGLPRVWHSNEAQFTRGGVVIVSSHNSNVTDENRLNRKFNRVIDLHETGQMFSSMTRPGVVPYIAGADFITKNTTALASQEVYVAADCTSAFDDISGSGAELVLGDDEGEFVLLGFSFTFYGADHIEAAVSSNGYLTFGGVMDNPNNVAIPNTSEPNNLIAPLWDNLNPAEGGTIHYETRGSEPSRTFTVQWTDVPRSGQADMNTFQVVLFEGDDSIEFRYRAGTPQPNADDTIGIENPAGSEGIAIDPTTIDPTAADVCQRISIEIQNGCDFDGDGTITAGEQLDYTSWTFAWDVVFSNQGPGGFNMPWTARSANPPLASPVLHPPLPPILDRIIADCFPVPSIENVPCEWVGGPVVRDPFPCTTVPAPAWNIGGFVAFTGFYADPVLGPFVRIRDFNVGARVLGEQVDDRFGTAVSSDGTWLYMSAPRHTALRQDVPLLPDARGNRFRSGTVYQYRIDTRASRFAPTRSQLWIEPGNIDNCFVPACNGIRDNPIMWPSVDYEFPCGCRFDTTMPVPHQYIIESVGSTRGTPPDLFEYTFEDDCAPNWTAIGGLTADSAVCAQNYPVGTAGYNMDRTPQIVGPHVNSQISFVRGVGDVNDDGIEDFAVGSSEVRDDFSDPQNPSGPKVGSIFIIFSRAPGLEGDYLLEDLARRPSDPSRLGGVLLKGENEGESIARVFDGAGDFNGDGVDDVIVGSENGSGGKGEAIVIFGSRTLLSPEAGFRLADVVDAGRAIRFIGTAEGDLAGANVAGAGDVDFDGNGDILIAAPNANPLNNPGGAPGAVYLIYGAREYQNAGVIDLSLVGTPEVPGVVYVGRNADDFLGGGEVSLVVNPDLRPTRAFSRGVAALGDIDGDGRADYAISSILADPNGKTNAGEIYVIYGKGDRPPLAP